MENHPQTPQHYPQASNNEIDLEKQEINDGNESPSYGGTTVADGSPEPPG